MIEIITQMFLLVIIPLWMVSAVIDYTNMSYVWQLKSYRWDRMFDFFTTRQGRDFLKKIRLGWRILWLVIFIFLPSELRPIYLLFVLCLELFVQIIQIINREWRRPAISYKVVILLCLSFGLEMVLLAGYFTYFNLLLLAAFRFAFFSVVVTCLYIGNEIILRIYKHRASNKLKHHPDLIIIGITGSYGKTTVKEFLGQILAKKYKVVKTPHNRNTAIAISKFILSTNFSNYDVFIVEIGAYRRYDVKFSAEIVNPTIGILTGINEQHLSLFGSIKNTQNAKYDLLRILPPHGLAITNSDNPYCRELLGEIKAKVKTFGLEAEFNPDALINKISETADGIYVVMELNDQEYDFFVPVPGKHNADNIAACMLVAMHLDMDFSLIKSALTNLRMPKGTMRKFFYGSSIVIDDSFNSNPGGFRAVLDSLRKYPSEKRRVVITRGILELGKKSDDIHEQIGNEIAFVADELVLVTRDYEKSLRKGVGDKYRTEVVVKDKPTELLDYVKKFKKKQAVILIENRIPPSVYGELTGWQS